MMPLSDIAAHMRACYPAEGCGLVLEDAKGALTFRPIPNIAGSTDTSSRTQRDGYVMDPKALLTALEETEHRRCERPHHAHAAGRIRDGSKSAIPRH